MKRIAVSLILVTFLGFYSIEAHARCTDEQGFVIDDGGCWNTLNSIAKTSIIRGIWSGRKIQNTAADLTSRWGSSSAPVIDLPEQTNIGDIIDYFDKLYSFPVNRDIEWRYAYILSALYLKDDDSNDRLSLLRFLRDYGQLPSTGKWIKTKSINEIVVETDFGSFDIKLSGISGNQKNAGITSKALNSLLVLQKSRFFGDCDGSEQSYVNLKYFNDFFDENGDLTAYVFVSGLSSCVNGQKIPISEILGESSSSLNSFLAETGLADVSDYVDPKWSKVRRDSRHWTLVYSRDQAKAERLYIHGSEKHPIIERINQVLVGVGN